QGQARRRRLHPGLGRRQPLALAHAARPDRRAPRLLVFLRCGRGYPAVRRHPKVLPARAGLQHRLRRRDSRAAVPPAPLSRERKDEPMKLTTMTHVTVDGVMQGNGGASDEDRKGGFERGGWAMGVFDDETM